MTGTMTVGPNGTVSRPARGVILAAIVVLVLVGVARWNPDPTLAIAASALAVLGAVLLIEAPTRLLLPSAALVTAGVAVLGHGLSSNVGWFAVCLVQAWCVLTGSRRAAVTYWAAAMALFAVEWLWVQPDPGWAAWMAGTTLTLLAGLLLRHELHLVAQLRAAQVNLADRTRADERTRIARELHDVIAHTLTVSLLHVTSARLAVEYDPGDAAHSLAEAERLGRQSLVEVRSIVGLLRDEDGGPGTTPMPGVAELGSLVDGFRAAGVPVALDMRGNAARLPATTGLAVYRIVQEALTNAARHAPSAQTEVRVIVAAASVELAVDSAGQPGRGVGSGVVGMRERAISVGGRCEAGPGGRGWLVAATVPFDPDLPQLVR